MCMRDLDNDTCKTYSEHAHTHLIDLHAVTVCKSQR